MSAKGDADALPLTPMQQAIIEAVNAARTIPEWRQIFKAERFEADMLSAIDARDVGRMERVGLAFITRVAGEGVVDRLDRAREQRAKGGRNSASKRRGRTSPYSKLLRDFERREGVHVTRKSALAIRKAAARFVKTDLSYINRLLVNRRDE